MIDIADREELEQYLLKRDIVKKDESYTIKYCKGGVSGTVVLVQTKEKLMIVKQALAQLNTKDVWFCDPNRMNIEYESNRIYHELMPENAPEVYFYDSENYIYGREAVPDGCKMWKEYLMAGKLDFTVAEKSIMTLVQIHNECSRKSDIKELFSNKEIFYGLRISPYFEFTAQKYPELKAYTEQVIKDAMEHDVTLVHGDYSPKNIMVTDNGISVLDYEVAHYGNPAFDLAFFSNHFILKSIKHNLYGKAYLEMLNYMIAIYFKQMDFMDKKKFETSFMRMLSLLMLARIDGKSPVEYLVGDEKRQQFIRDMCMRMIDEQMLVFDQFLASMAAALDEFNKNSEE